MKTVVNYTVCFSLLFLTVILSSCASSRYMNYPYEKVADLAKKEFAKNCWTKTGTFTSKLTENSDSIEIEYYDWQFPNIKIYGEISVRKTSKNKTKLSVYIKDCDSWFYPFNANPQMATDLLDAFEKQLKWYKLTKMDKPWSKFNKE